VPEGRSEVEDREGDDDGEREVAVKDGDSTPRTPIPRWARPTSNWNGLPFGHPIESATGPGMTMWPEPVRDGSTAQGRCRGHVPGVTQGVA
jgi:hypothetical protein